MSSATWRRYGTFLFWIVAGSMHFIRPGFYEAIVPPPLDRYKREVVIASGIAELAGGLAVVPGSTRRLARGWLLATLLAVYPANVYMAIRARALSRHPAIAALGTAAGTGAVRLDDL